MVEAENGSSCGGALGLASDCARWRQKRPSCGLSERPGQTHSAFQDSTSLQAGSPGPTQEQRERLPLKQEAATS